MLDNFLSKTLHHVMSPLHALRGTVELISGRLQDKSAKDETEKNCDLLERAADAVTLTTRMVADVSDLARFDEGATLKTSFKNVDLRDIGVQAIEDVKFTDLRLKGGDDGIDVSLNLIGQGGPGAIRTDRAVLLRALAHLLENAVREVPAGGKVTLQMTSANHADGRGAVLVEIIDNGKGLPTGTCLDDGLVDNAPAPSHRYVVSRKTNKDDPVDMEKARAEMEEGLRSLKQNGVGVGLPLSYHLVRMLGGDLRYEKLPVGTRMYFTLQDKADGKEMAVDKPVLKSEKISKAKKLPTEISFAPKAYDTNKRRRVEDFEFGNFVSSYSSMTSGDTDSTSTPSSPAMAEPKAEAVAKCGVRAELPFSVLIVEDTDICARVLGMQLKKVSRMCQSYDICELCSYICIQFFVQLKCSTQRAENGQVAIDLLKSCMPGTFDMVLMDLRMPVMDGLTATKLIRDELKMMDLPILALTGERRDDIQGECAGIGFTDFYQKPLPKKKLEDLVTKYKAIRDGTA
jgi:CheY-like chemotaxis protein